MPSLFMQWLGWSTFLAFMEAFFLSLVLMQQSGNALVKQFEAHRYYRQSISCICIIRVEAMLIAISPLSGHSLIQGGGHR